jgi:transcriptional regulator with XRE-family HTH domain
MAKERTAVVHSEQEWRQLGERLRESREYLGFSQEAVASYLEIPRAAVSAMENGKRKVSSVELRKLAQLYKRPYAYFLGDDAEEPEVDDTTKALFRMTREMTERDREQVLRFAQFLKDAGAAPRVSR